MEYTESQSLPKLQLYIISPYITEIESMESTRYPLKAYKISI